ncbi:dienelactone hydrolase family protein [Massilia sp. RP-1-19]|uniref:Dienelactone hydrolase family protein n=1 Tax=Massilia polaris TaxID=2728846 RepID=A0A848HFS1_9BURK|nr:dienelactone hydrolase family protein [Massilia polaris]NML60064.1 dienelactone hydrolase family protein [Massilia polaris]
MNERIKIDTPDGSFGAYVAKPATTPAPAIVVIQEIFGINADLRETCDQLAAQGFIAICPDLFWRMQPGVELTDQSKAEWAKAMEFYQKFDIDKGVEDIGAALQTARTYAGSNGKVGVMGFCLGGLMTFLTAARKEPDAAAAYYGGRTNEYVSEFKSVSCPMIMHLGEADEYIPPPAREKITKAAEEHANVTVYTYAGQNHAFARHRGTHYDAASAKLANQRTFEFFKKHLG